MSRATVRTAIQSYLAGAQISMLGNVYAHVPRYTDEQEFYLNDAAGVASGAVIWIYLQNQNEARFALGGSASGAKMRHYRCILLCVLKSAQQTSEAADADNDTFIDSLVAAIEANRVANDAAVIFQWGEGDTLYGPDIFVHSGMPRSVRGQSFQVFNRVEVSVMEQIST